MEVISCKDLERLGEKYDPIELDFGGEGAFGL
jgi:hypothetical protein